MIKTDSTFTPTARRDFYLDLNITAVTEVILQAQSKKCQFSNSIKEEINYLR